MIAIGDLKPGFLYRLRARNIAIGVWNPVLHANKGLFVGIRTKFTNVFLDGELHYDADQHFGTAKPLEEIIKCPLSDIRIDRGTICGRCQDEFNISAPVAYLPYNDGPRTHTYTVSGKEWTNTYPSGWQHLEETGKCSDTFGRMVSNPELFNWLEWAEKEFVKE